MSDTTSSLIGWAYDEPRAASPVHSASDWSHNPTETVANTANKVPSFTPSAGTVRSSKFWFADGSVVIKIGNTLYNVHRSILTQQSGFLRSKLSTVNFFPDQPIKTTKTTKWSLAPRVVQLGSLQHPISLDVIGSEFETLLSYIYPTDYQLQYSFTVQEWTAIANVSKELQLTSIRAAAVDNILKNAGALDLIDIGRKHELPECCLEGFRLLCYREKSLSLEEGQRLGLASVIMIAHARDMLAKNSNWSEVGLEFSVHFEVEK